MLTVFSDDGPPKKSIEQILAVAAILPGQSGASRQQPTQPQQQQSTQTQQRPAQAQQQPVPTQQQPARAQQQQQQPAQRQQINNNSDLIDFGQNDGSRTSTPRPGPTQHAAPPMSGLQQPLVPTNNDASFPLVTRTDSIEGGTEEFVDAES